LPTVAEPRFSQRLSTSARGGYDRAIDLLERLVPLARALWWGVVVFAALAAAAGLAIAGTVLWADAPSTGTTWLLYVLFVVVLLAPSAVLVVFALTLRETLQLPDKLRQLPDVAPQRAGEVARLVAEARQRERTISLRTLPQDSWRAGRLLVRLHDDIPWAGVLLRLVRIPFLLLVLAALVVGLVEILLAPAFIAYAVLITLL
jgi:hypothetical protein